MERVRYTIRDIPPILDREIRIISSKRKVSINKLLIEALKDYFLKEALNVPAQKRDLSWFIGKDNISEEFNSEVEDMRKIDKELWE